MDLFSDPPFEPELPGSSTPKPPNAPKPAFAAPVISVSELNRRVREAIERSLPLAWVAGEISNLRRYDSGHWYFTLKDATAQVDCVMFRQRAQGMEWQLSLIHI